MIKLTDKDKTLVVPAGLGNFGQSAGSGGGVTPEEAAQIASAVTAEALDEYDTELQVDLEDIRDAVSGNSEDIATLSATTDEISQQIGSLSGLTDDIAAISGQTTANTQDIVTLSGDVETNALAIANLENNVVPDLQEGIAAAGGLAESANTKVEALSAVTSGLVEDVEVLERSLIVFDFPSWSGTTKELFDAISDAYYNKGKNVALYGNAQYSNGKTLLRLVSAESGSTFTFEGEAQPSTVTSSDLYLYKVILYAGGATSGVSNKIFTRQKINSGSVPTASSSTKGGIKVGSGLTMNGDYMSIKVGDGLGFSGDTLVVSGATGGGGIPKVSVLPDNPEDGDVVFLEGYELTGYTVVKENVDNWEAGYAMCHINDWGDNIYSDGYGANYGRYFDNNGIKMRYRKDETNLYLDLIGDIESISIEGLDSDSYAENSFPFLGRYFKYSDSVGMWLPLDYKVYVDYEKDYDTLKGLWLEIYEGLSDFSSNSLVVLKKNDRNQTREFVPYESKYYGMDFQACDGRGAQDGNFGRISVESYRCSYDYEYETLTFGILTGEAFTTTESDVRGIVNQTISIAYANFGNEDRGYLTYDADNDRFEYDSSYVSTGDTSNACPDLVDWLITKQGIVDGGLIFDYICVQNLNKLFVVSGGTTHTYTHPAIGFVELASPYTIGDYYFNYEITYKYADWELKIDMSENNNVGANIRITAL